MAGIHVTIKGSPALRALERSLEPARARAILDAVARAAFGRIGQIGQAMIRDAIRADSYAANSPITVILKGSSKPLVRRGDLIQSVSYDQPDARSLRIGLVKMKVHNGNTYDLGVILHEGATIDVGAHPKIRIKVWAMVAEALGKQRSKGSQSATNRAFVRVFGTSSTAKNLWIIPPRPYIEQPLGGALFAARVQRVYEQAAEQAVRRIARGD